MEFSTKEFIVKNKTLFEDVNDSYSNMKGEYDTMYSILDYEKIFSEMIEYLQGYAKYAESGDDKYAGKVLSTTKQFYDNMFSDKKYRREITLSDFRNLNKTFLVKTKELQTLLEKYSEDRSNTELCAMCSMTDKQYRKLGKVHKDDMKIYLWLTTSNSKVFHKELDDDTKRAFHNKETPVMHQLKNN